VLANLLQHRRAVVAHDKDLKEVYRDVRDDEVFHDGRQAVESPVRPAPVALGVTEIIAVVDSHGGMLDLWCLRRIRHLVSTTSRFSIWFAIMVQAARVPGSSFGSGLDSPTVMSFFASS